MKKKLLGFLLTTALLFVASAAVLAGCSDKNKVTYAVTVFSFDGETPAEGITVSWQQSGKRKGTAVTDENGRAEADLPAGTYSVVLTGLDEGVSYTSVSVNSAMRSVMLTLERVLLRYSAMVIDKTGSPVAGAIVVWSNDKGMAGSATTGEDGMAVAEIMQGTYQVSVANLPSENVFNGFLSADISSPDIRFDLVNGVNDTYTVTVKSQYGMIFSNIGVNINIGNAPIAYGTTNAEGVFTCALSSGNYTVTINAPEGYTCVPTTLPASTKTAQVTLSPSLIMTEPTADKTYGRGDVIHNYSFTTPYNVNGRPATYTIAELLKTKKAILINNWGVNCSWCVTEMPAMEEAYQKYKDDIEMLAVSNYMGGDTNATINSFRQSNELTFPMMRDTNNLAARFGLTGWPTTIIIDRYGVVARIEEGAVLTSSAWEKMIAMFIGDDYEQNFTYKDNSSGSINGELAKPDITLPDDHYDRMAELFNASFADDPSVSVRWYPELEYEYAWPFLYATSQELGLGNDDTPVLYSSNTGKNTSMSILYGAVKTPAGKVFAFDYYSDTETADLFSVVWDGKVVKEISGVSNGWQTDYIYTDLTDDEHSIAFAYVKNSYDDELTAGKDNVYLRNLRFIDFDDFTKALDEENKELAAAGKEQKSVYMLRGAAYGTPQAGAETFPHYAEVKIGSDGYYHVVSEQLVGKQYAGVDTAPMLMANLLGVTNWLNSMSINALVTATDATTGELLIDCNFTVNKITKDYRADLSRYLRVASASDVENCMPVDKELHDLLVAFLQRVSGNSSNENEWLEVCYFYSCYGANNPIQNPILGLTEKTAYEIDMSAMETGNTVTEHTDLTRLMAPFPINIHTFTAPKDGVYHIQSLLPATVKNNAGQTIKQPQSTQAWLYSDKTGTNMDHPLVYCGSDYITRNTENEYNFSIHRYMEAGETYYLALSFQMMDSGEFDFSITYEGASKTVEMPTSGNLYYYVLDDLGNISGEIQLADAIEYRYVQEDGYYHAVNPDGTTGGIIYLDVTHPSVVGGSVSIKTALNLHPKDPSDLSTDLDFYLYDFSKRTIFIATRDENNDLRITDWSIIGVDDLKVLFPDDYEKFKDYTARMKEIVAQGEENDGLVPVTEEIKQILTLYIEMRNNAITIDEQGRVVEYDKPLENEWLRFCWYNRPYDANNR